MKEKILDELKLCGAALTLALLLGHASALAATPFTCPAADPGFSAGCVPVKKAKNASSTWQIFYQVYRTLDPARETILFLNGGPGGLMSQFTELPALLSQLSPRFNLIFFDPRGVGRSEKPEAWTPADLEGITTDNNIQDIETLRARLVGDRPVIVFGHSYGAHLALGYATRFPAQVSRVVALNGAVDELGFLLQSYEKQVRLDSAVRGFDPNEINALFTILASGQAVNRRGEPVSLGEFVAGLIGYLTTYHGQTVLIPEIVEAYLKLNVRKSSFFSPQSTPPSDNPVRIELPGIDPVVNPYIVCHDLLPAAKIDALADEAVKAAAAQGRQLICQQALAQHEDREFDVKNDLRNIRAPIFIAGGDHDPLVPVAVQDRDFELLFQAGVLVRYLRMQNTGHDPLAERPDCILPELLRFLGGDTNGVDTAKIACPQA